MIAYRVRVLGRAVGVTARVIERNIRMREGEINAVGQVRFVFDKPVDDNLTYEAKNFMIMTPAGDLVRASSMVEVTGNTILMNFDKNIVHAARGVVVNDDAAQDFQGQKSPARTIKI